MLDTLKSLIAALLDSIKAHTLYWAGGAGGVLVIVAVALVLTFGNVFGPSGRAICHTAFDQAKNYGVIPQDASQSDASGKATEIEGRRACEATGGGETYTLYADLKCNDLKKDDCLSLYAVERSDGLSMYQMRQVPDDGDESVAAAQTGEEGAQQQPQQQQQSSASELTDVEVAKPANSQ